MNVDPLYVFGCNNLSMIIGNIAFNGNAFYASGRSILMILGAKLKLGFIELLIAKPKINSVDWTRWTQYDYMMRCWLLNSMISKLAQSFLCAQSALELWKKIFDQYG